MHLYTGGKKKYKDRISGPIIDRIDLHIEVEPVDYEKLSSKGRRKPLPKSESV